MMPIEQAVLSHLEDVSDATRARELFKYYQPTAATAATQAEVFADSTGDEESVSFNDLKITSNVSSSKISSPDTALTAFAQLVSWRTGAQRAMISVIDSETQYFIAESTKTVDLVDNTRHRPGDELWIGCGQVPKAGRLCERTIRIAATKPGEYPAFIVNDLSADPRFSHLEFVSGPPYLKFYAGSPLITKNRIPIGSLFIVDSRPRSGFSNDDIHFLGTMAATIMRHMEMAREVEEHRRGMKMSRGLASFVEGRAELAEDEIDFDHQNLAISRTHENYDPSGDLNPNSFTNSIDRKEREYSNEIVQAEEALMAKTLARQIGLAADQPDLPTHLKDNSYDSASVSTSPPPTHSMDKIATSPQAGDDDESSTLKKLFSRAASLITEAFELTGSVFLDAQKGFDSEYSEEKSMQTKISAGDQFTGKDESRTDVDSRPEQASSNDEPPPDVFQPLRANIFGRYSIGPEKLVDILGFSTKGASSLHGDEPDCDVFSQLDEKFLHSLLRRYPRGKMWTLNEDGCVSSSDDDKNGPIIIVSPILEQPRRLSQARRRKVDIEAKKLSSLFPGVHQILFVPLWDGSRSRWLSACFAWSTDKHRILSKSNELAFLAAFCNSVMAECSRIDTETADQKKGDFIGSISHELRSPLHGILASAEFLGEEVTEGFSKGLVETIDSCGRTLLDTINHILDFSKINSFEKQWRRSQGAASIAIRAPGGSRSYDTLKSRKTSLPMMNLFAEVDIGVIFEEVIESVFAGHVFQIGTAPIFDIRDTRSRKNPNETTRTSSSESVMEPQSVQSAEVAVILDIDIQNYHFITQPGAFRRIIMNILGNALKYTSHGYVLAKLEATEMEDLQVAGSTETVPRSQITLTVTDTGKGISKDFMRSKLFTPFAQQSSLSSGTGLGLSIVRSIVALLEGQIQIRSEEKQGTKVIVTLPLLRELPKGSGSSALKPSLNTGDEDETINQTRGRVIGKTVCMVGFVTPTEDQIILESQKLLRDSVTMFLENWYSMRIVADPDSADIIIVDDPDASVLAKLARPKVGFRRGSAVLALCSHSSRFDRAHWAPRPNTNVGFLAKPVGPVKLARALSQCLDGVPIVSTPGILNPSGFSSKGPDDLTSLFDHLSVSPHGAGVLDNARIAAPTENARRAIQTPTPNANAESLKEFPFLTNTPKSHASQSTSLSVEKPNMNVPARAEGQSRSVSNVEKSTLNGPKEELLDSKSAPSSPTLLLVDDNVINLKLLRTFMHKRRYQVVDEAENGLEAVKAFQERQDGYNIIFMDISMPVLDGFGATRQIRRIERTRREAAEAKGLPFAKPALIIALTGLASSQDQNEAFASGVDLFLTKPVSFKEVGKMLDNWVAHEGMESSRGDNVPYGQ